MNLKDYPRKVYSINQFTQPPCFELEGEKFFFVMDDGYDYELDITGKDTCTWNISGEAPKSETYQCLKSDDTTYILRYEVKDADPRVGHTFVIDLEQRLVTMLVCKMGVNPKHPFLVYSHFDFGAIRIEGEALPFKRHGFTTDLIGTCVEWHWRSKMFTQHSYYCTDFYRITLPKSSEASQTLASTVRNTPSSDEPARYIKIKDKMYLFMLTEANSERIDGATRTHRSNNMVFLQNYDRMYHVGRTFGTNMVDGKPVPTNILFGAFGNPVELDPEFLNAPNPYIV
ncbi:MAG: molybdenum cofactor biosynthesis F family protein [Peptococcaceae bacterium]|nr:molybdenum cofactor biosynthesis F family protein [Peptococcaceae bacterium]